MRCHKYLILCAAAILLASFNVVVSATVAYACPEETFETNDREFIAKGQGCQFNNGGTTYGDKQTSRTKTINNGPKIRYEVTYYQECSPAMTLVKICVANADPPCADGSYTLTRLIKALNGPRAGQVISVRQYCTVEPTVEVPGAEQDIAKVTPDQFRRMPIIASTIVSQPEGFSLRNGNAHLYASSKTQNFKIELFDQSVRVRAIPMTYLWSYGDGTSRTLNFPGSSAPIRSFDEPTSTSHVYKETGDFRVGLTTRYRGEYSTEGGPWTPIPGVANVPSESITMSVWRTKKILVAENCSQSPSAPGCASLFDD
ncbi:hypothetical protein ACIPVK_11875 [Paeniglutamicibacter sp. MACA_103]|uniref:hypothetical protein n=1 Tax=Paeniglutamicibacter sp. MACA_103 TaxID=3377337 RepID=UPI0038961FAE